MATGHDRLRAAVREYKVLTKRRRELDGVDLNPGCAYGSIVKMAVDELRGDVEGIREELAWIRRCIVAAIVTAAVGTLLRLGGLIP